MAANENPGSGVTPLERDDSARLKRKLAWRMGFAGLMIVALLGGLTLFDYLAADTVETEPPLPPPRFTETVPVPQKTTEALGTVAPAPAEEPEDQGPSVPEATAAPEGPVVVDAAPPPPPDVAAEPTVSPVARPPSRSASTASSSTSTGVRPARTAPPRANVFGTETRPPPLVPRRTETVPPRADAPETSAATPASVSLVRPPVLSRLLSGHTLQAGVFTDPRRAEDIQARLVREGIPATLETRVLVGPFKSQSEAEAARVKMKAMGIEALPITQSGKK
ncbi:MAG: SPOR domain-containing protein [Candidatus Accumulibacter sp.]|jgi:hypothetical protein|nr:SPOR domain-containing protein [Accumulibacter sp.]